MKTNFIQNMYGSKHLHNNIISFGMAQKIDTKNVSSPVLMEQKPVNIQVSADIAKRLMEFSKKLGLTPEQYLVQYARHLAPSTGVAPEESVTANVGRTKVTSLIDAEQIFKKTLEYVQSAEKSIQVEMFEFQNMKIDGKDWPSNGAEANPGWEYQQKLLDAIVQQKKNRPNMKVQVILDVHKWFIDGNGSKERDYSFVDKTLIEKGLVKKFDKYRKYANMDMIKYLKENGIDVVPYPRGDASQSGAILQHVKLLAVDSKKAIIGGMNWGNHSSANHDVCVAVEQGEDKNGKLYENTEVDNIIENIFNKDWKFAWQRIGEAEFIQGPLTSEEQVDYNGIKKKIKPENIEYKQKLGEIYNTPECKNRYKNGALDLIEVHPMEKPAINVLSNKPRELSEIGAEGSESIGAYIKDRLKTANSLTAELFVLSHKEIVSRVIERWKEAQAGGRPFDAKILISPDILDEFPYCQKAFLSLLEAGVPIRTFKTQEAITQRLHCKLAIFDNKDVIIGSSNWSAVGLEQNLGIGKRPDYELTNKQIDDLIINKHEKTVKELEKEFGLKSIFTTKTQIQKGEDIFIKKLLITRKKELKAELTSATEKLQKTDKEVFIDLSGKTIEMTPENITNLKRLLKRYNDIQGLENSKEKFHRGNNECAIVFTSPKIAETFVKQFDKDWKYSDIKGNEPYMPTFQGGLKNSLNEIICKKEPRFDQVM
ncbi:MAG: phospholipase D-like domain-containing protein [Candidatus Gastranaerophilaceae bacterium]|jgi:phosphatidylserine/phosphatidylglycerophosphate/cardiolipin synthase-like enzyme